VQEVPGETAMMSPLLPYANAYLLIVAQGVPTVVDGRFVPGAGQGYLVKCYLSRQDSTGVTTGADYLPSRTTPGDILPGVGGDVYLYRGYALGYAEVPGGHELGVDAPPLGPWIGLLSDAVPDWLRAGVIARHLQGREAVKHSKIERSSGKFGGTDIDFQVSVNIGGIPIIVRSGDVLN
jgi:hypothetical protein